MPKEITVEELESVLPRTLAAYAKRSGDFIKYKLRTKGTLYTIKTETKDSEKIKDMIEKTVEIENLD